MILHITTRQQWEEAILSGSYHNRSLTDEGFIHCSNAQQILRSANLHYRGQLDLLLLCILPEALKAPLIFEDSYDKGEQFPHIYGPLNLDAVVHVFNFPPDHDGLFHLPQDYSDICWQPETQVSI